MGLMTDLGRGPVGVDTVVFIYTSSKITSSLFLLEPLFREVDGGRRELFTSALTLSEVLVVPYRSGDHLLAGRYEALLTQSRGGAGGGDFARSSTRRRTAKSCKRSQDTGLSPVGGSFGGRLHHFSDQRS